MKTNLKRLLINALLTAFCLTGCVDSYEVRYDLSANILTVEGFVRDSDITVVSLRLSKSYLNSVLDVPVSGSVVEILVGNGTKVSLKETEPGIYTAPNDFRGVAGQTYQLQFKNSDGNSYKSGIEKLNSVPTIKKVYQKFNQNGQLSADGKTTISSTFDIYIDTEDPAGEKNFYLWEWSLWEKLFICITCNGGLLNGTTCTPIASRTPPTFDYVCQGNCFGILKNKDINVLADTYVNALPLVGRLIAKTPYYSDYGGLIEVRQYGVSATAYDYFKLLRDQVQTTGTLTDTPPAAIIGNIQNLNDPTEKVVGYFGASGLSKTRFWIDRSGVKGGILIPVLGREANLEPSSPFRPPTMPCQLSKDRTPFQPEGWR
jgi:Domain of unknown function (DUF4249)